MHPLQSDGGTVRIHQNEVFDPISFVNGGLDGDATNEFVRRASMIFSFSAGHHVIPIVIASCIELVCCV